MYNNPKYSIVIPTYNHLHDCLIPCLNSIKEYTDLANIEVIVVANGCVDETAEYVNNLGYPFILIEEKKQLGYTKATNLGLKAAKGEYIVLLNNDAQLLPQTKNYWLETLARPFEVLERTGMTGPMLFKGIEGQSNDFIMFFCAMTTRKIIDEVGYLDEIYSPGGVEDIDYGLRLILADYKLISVPINENVSKNPNLSTGSFPIYHPGGTTCSKEPGWNEILVRNNNILKKKFPQYFRGIDWIEDLEKKQSSSEEKTNYVAIDNSKALEVKTTQSQIDMAKEYLKRVALVVLATGSYSQFIRDLVDSINVYFLPNTIKDIYILSDVFASGSQHLSEKCIVHNINCRSISKASYYFELLLENLRFIVKSDYVFKFDADMFLYDVVLEDDFLPQLEQNFTAVKHFGYSRKDMAKNVPKTCSAYIPEEYWEIEPYWQSCIFGGKTKNMIEMAVYLNQLIVKDRQEGKLYGAWEEPYVNHYLALRQNEVKSLSVQYAAPLYWHRFMHYRDSYQNKVDMPVKIFHLNNHSLLGMHPQG